MTTSMKRAYKHEMKLARTDYASAQLDEAFARLERAHILGQKFFVRHMETHWWMLKIGIRRSDLGEIVGQLFRIIAVIPGFLFFWIPTGNTGGANVNPLKPMPIPEDLAKPLNEMSAFHGVLTRFAALFAIAICIAGGLAVRSDRVRADEAETLEAAWLAKEFSVVPDFGSTQSLEVIPLVNWHAQSSNFKTEPGVSYLVKVDDQTILFDVGFNQAETSPSPLEHNMHELDVSLSEINTVFISHLHRDHVGGIAWAQSKTFSLGDEQVDLSDKTIIGPMTTTYPGSSVRNIDRP